MSDRRFYVTTPIYYVNARPHLGHLYTTLLADALARHYRQRGFETFFLTGTDEHGLNIERAAAERSVKEHVDAIVTEFKATFAAFGLEPDDWIRTTDPAHIQGAQALWRRVRDRGYIYKGYYEGWYCSSCNEFKDEAAPGEAPICDIHQRPTERVAEESYFFKLSAFRDRLLAFYEAQPAFIQPDARRNEVVSFVSANLRDLSVSRVSVKWGIPVPDDPAHTMYVWFDALSNYITALGFGNDARTGFDKFWPHALHLVGKDILRFHAVYWPAFLMAAELPPPRRIFSHGMWLSGGRKMSKTPDASGRSNAIDLGMLRRHFSNDVVRYFCLREMAYGQDGDFTYEALIDRANGDLASGFGNLASRTLTLIRKAFDGAVPNAPLDAPPDAREAAAAIAERFAAQQAAFLAHIERLALSRALESAWELVALLDKHLSDTAPWKLTGDPEARPRLATILHTAAEGLRHLTAWLYPFLPEATTALWSRLGLPGRPAQVAPESLSWQRFENAVVSDGPALFPRLDKTAIMNDIKATTPPVAAPPASAATPAAAEATAASETGYITIDDFAKVELRVGQVLEAERVPKADKLLRLQVDVGEATPRQILAGIAQHYAPETLIGRKIIVVTNLAPRKLRGLESNGMLLAASVGEQGRPVIATFAEDVANGARLK
ncbi:MAG: methionine--tRNA ligase [Chloracidobacterium sp. CP2_5A]|nr:MAG: methionine--tRNA ligase [Chloracidobacterium sp. CP2_5A]